LDERIEVPALQGQILDHRPVERAFLFTKHGHGSLLEVHL
jgi:hypothetical protein